MMFIVFTIQHFRLVQIESISRWQMLCIVRTGWGSRGVLVVAGMIYCQIVEWLFGCWYSWSVVLVSKKNHILIYIPVSIYILGSKKSVHFLMLNISKIRRSFFCKFGMVSPKYTIHRSNLLQIWHG